MVDKLVLDNVTWSHFIFRFSKTFCNHAPWNKLCGNINFITFGHMDQKLWGNKKFRKNLGKVGMCWSQLARVDHMCKKCRQEEKRKFCKGAHAQERRATVCHQLALAVQPMVDDCQLDGQGWSVTRAVARQLQPTV